MRAGHATSEVMDYSPRRIVAFWILNRRAHERAKAEALQIAALGAQGKDKDINKQIKSWQAE